MLTKEYIANNKCLIAFSANRLIHFLTSCTRNRVLEDKRKKFPKILLIGNTVLSILESKLTPTAKKTKSFVHFIKCIILIVYYYYSIV